MIALLVVVSLLCAGTVHGQRECEDGLTACSDVYVDAINNHTTQIELLCGDMNSYLECVLELRNLDCGPTFGAIVEQIALGTQAQLEAGGSACKIEAAANATASPGDLATINVTGCMEGMQVCTNSYSEALYDHIQQPDLACGDINSYVDCLFELTAGECGRLLLSTVQELSNQAQLELKDAGSDCNIAALSNLTTIGDGANTTSMPVITTTNSWDCNARTEACTNSYTDALYKHMNQPEFECGDINSYIDCLFDVKTLDCGPTWMTTVQEIATQAQQDLQAKQSDCKISALATSTVSDTVATVTTMRSTSPNVVSTSPEGCEKVQEDCTNTLQKELSDHASEANARSLVCNAIEIFMNCLRTDGTCSDAVMNEMKTVASQFAANLGYVCGADGEGTTPSGAEDNTDDGRGSGNSLMSSHRNLHLCLILLLFGFVVKSVFL